jgi:hypothetical protein
MICAIKLDGQFIFLDGTDPNIPFGVPPSPIQGKEALIAINETSYKVITVPIIDAAKNHTIDSTKLTLDGNLLKGNVAIHYNGYQAWRVAGVLQYTNEKSMSDVIKSITERGSNKYLLTDNGFKYGTTSDKPLVVTATFTLADYARQLDNEYYINLHLSRLFEEEYADEKERKVPISFSYKMKRSDVVVLNIPQGYTASYIPENKEESVPGLWSYKITYKQNGKQIVMQKDFELFTLYIELAQFKDHNKMVKSLKAQQKEAVVLKKQ